MTCGASGRGPRREPRVAFEVEDVVAPLGLGREREWRLAGQRDLRTGESELGGLCRIGDAVRTADVLGRGPCQPIGA